MARSSTVCSCRPVRGRRSWRRCSACRSCDAR
jgi:hypothetical protein